MRLPEQSESAFGMAILAAAAAGGERVADVARRMSRTAEVLEPRPSMRAHLDEQYARLPPSCGGAAGCASARPATGTSRLARMSNFGGRRWPGGL